MKGFVSLSFLTLALMCSAAVGRAGLIINVTLDEVGNGTSSFPSATALPSGFLPDPSGGAASVLTYLLPFAPTVDGDVQLNDSAVALVLGDVVRFFTVAGNHYMLFYSDNGDGVDSTADNSGLPVNALTNVVTLTEVGPEGNNGATYTPGAGQPGFISTDFTPTYTITSDSTTTPEPASVLLMVGGLVGFAGFKKFRRQ